jgi:hypothetical protein
MEHDTIPMEFVVGTEETTVWLWPDTPDPVTVRFSLRKWAKIERKAEREWNGDIQALISEVVAQDLSA